MSGPRFPEPDKTYVPKFRNDDALTVYLRPWRCPACSHLNGNMVRVKEPEPFRVDCERCGAVCDGYHPKADLDPNPKRYVQIKPVIPNVASPFCADKIRLVPPPEEE